MVSSTARSVDYHELKLQVINFLVRPDESSEDQSLAGSTVRDAFSTEHTFVRAFPEVVDFVLLIDDPDIPKILSRGDTLPLMEEVHRMQ